MKIKVHNVCWAVIVLFSSCGPAEYRHFLNAKPEYYEKIAGECDSLLAHPPIAGNAEARQFARQTNSLPPTIRGLKPSRIQINSNFVLITLDSHHIIWRQREDDPKGWTLTAYEEGHRKEVYTRKGRSIQK